VLVTCRDGRGGIGCVKLHKEMESIRRSEVGVLCGCLFRIGVWK